jgi:hypothetical protein
MWSIPQGNKLLNNTIADAKSLVRLAEMVATEQEIAILREKKPNASKVAIMRYGKST